MPVTREQLYEEVRTVPMTTAVALNDIPVNSLADVGVAPGSPAISGLLGPSSKSGKRARGLR